MATSILMVIVGLLLFVVTPLIGYVNQSKTHHTDLMAGDGGED
jgi:hypothetical protein